MKQDTKSSAVTESFDLMGLSTEELTDVLDCLLQQGKDSLYVKFYSMAYKKNMEDSARAMHNRKYELNITRKGNNNRKDK